MIEAWNNFFLRIQAFSLQIYKKKANIITAVSSWQLEHVEFHVNSPEKQKE